MSALISNALRDMQKKVFLDNSNDDKKKKQKKLSTSSLLFDVSFFLVVVNSSCKYDIYSQAVQSVSPHINSIDPNKLGNLTAETASPYSLRLLTYLYIQFAQKTD